MNVIIGFMLFGVAAAHLCLLNPQQRGPITANINKPGASECFYQKSPCGGQATENPHTIYQQGSTIRVTFQKNLDHWTKASPGSFNVSIRTEQTDWQKLAEIKDNGEPTLHIYSTDITIPKTLQGTGILQVTYETKNPKAPPAFYQCSDIKIEAGHQQGIDHRLIFQPLNFKNRK